MNSKLCKNARRIARKLSVGMVDYELIGRTSAINSPKSTRGIYKQVKRFLRAGLSLAEIERNA